MTIFSGKISRLVLLMLLAVHTNQLLAQQSHQIEILNARSMEYNKFLGINAQRLIGDVVFRHQGATMYCDSAWFYADENKVDAFGNIHIIQGDTLTLSGQLLNYDGNTKVAKIRRNVILVDRETVLKSPSLDYYVNEGIGSYNEGGVITNREDTLKSRLGYYYSKIKTFYFKRNVQVLNPNYSIYSDTLKYNTISEIAWFFGPTHIYSKDNYVYCENGWYNTRSGISQFNRNAFLKSKNQLLKGDSLYYDRSQGIGKAFMNVSMFDSVQQVLLTGNKAYYTERPESAVLTDSAVMVQINQTDSMFIHADTLRSLTTDTVTMTRIMRAYYHVKIFKSDMQARCDSLSYNTADSIIRLNGSPVLWSDVHQLTSTLMQLHLRNNKPFMITMEDMAFIASMEDSMKYNQIRGKRMEGYIHDNELTRIDVSGNGQTVYYAKDGPDVVGLNKAESSDLVIYLKNKKVDRILFLTKPNSVLYPLDQVPPGDVLLKDFKWLDEYRPLNKADIFRWK